jgi:hypothetical protein
MSSEHRESVEGEEPHQQDGLLPFRYFTLDPGRPSHVWNPIGDPPADDPKLLEKHLGLDHDGGATEDEPRGGVE